MTSPTPSPISDQAAGEPIPMLLFCPKCHSQHIDSPKWERDLHDMEQGLICTWSNPPHKSHLCHACGNIWRPADVTTTGVVCIQTRGKADTWESTAPTTGSAPAPIAWYIADDNGEVYAATGYEHERDGWRSVGHVVYDLFAAPASPAASAPTREKMERDFYKRGFNAGREQGWTEAPGYPATINQITSILACEIECSIFERHVAPALEIARTAIDAALPANAPVASVPEQGPTEDLNSFQRRLRKFYAPSMLTEHDIGREIFFEMKPINMINADWDSGCVLGADNGFRHAIMLAAKRVIALLAASTGGDKS